MKFLLNLKNSFSLSQIENLSLFSNFDRLCVIIFEYIYDITSFIIRKRTNKSKNKIKFSSLFKKLCQLSTKRLNQMT
jgi:hypothetical protein